MSTSRLTGIIIATLFISIILQTAHIRENILDTYKKAVQFYIPTISNNKKKVRYLYMQNVDAQMWVLHASFSQEYMALYAKLVVSN